MARPFWSGELTFGLVMIPAKLYTARRNLTPTFHQLHRECGSRISMVRRCPKCNRDIEWAEIGKGYAVARGEYACFTAAELARIDELAARTPGNVVALADYRKPKEAE